jgi:hypothetical protein
VSATQVKIGDVLIATPESSGSVALAPDQTLKKDAGKLPAHLIAPEALGQWAVSFDESDFPFDVVIDPGQACVMQTVGDVALWWSRGGKLGLLVQALGNIVDWPGVAADCVSGPV